MCHGRILLDGINQAREEFSKHTETHFQPIFKVKIV